MLNRKIAPTHAEFTSFTLPTPELIKLSNGVPLVILRGVSQQILKIELVFNGAKWDESKNGLSYFTALMLEKGTATKTSFEIADFFDQHGASIEISPGFDFVSVSLFSLTKNVTKVLPVFIELLTGSAFHNDEFALQKAIFKQNLKINNEKTSYVASKLIRQHLFGSSHPYGRSIEQEDLDLLECEDLFSFFQNRFSFIQSFIVGSFDDAILSFITSQLSTISSNLKKPHPIFSITQNETSEYLKIANSIQSSLRLGKRTINRDHQHYPALLLINHIFGGYFGSRLMKNVREDKGLTYGIYSSLNKLKNDAFIVIGADVNKTNRDLALEEIKKELNILSEKLINTQELKNAKNHLLGSLQLEIANPFSVIEKIKTIHLYNLDEKFYDNLFHHIIDLDEATLQEVSGIYFSGGFIDISVG